MPPFVCRSILTSNVWNNEINIELLNILVHSRSKVEVFFWQTLPPPAPPPPLPSQMHCVHRPTQSITRHLAGEKALSQGGCFLVLPALLFQRAPGRPRWWTLWSSLAGSFGTLFNLPSPPSPITTSACFTHLMFSAAPSFVPAVLCTPFWQWWLLYLHEFSLAKWLGLQRPATLRSRSRASQGVDDYVVTTNAGERRYWKRIFRL